MANKPLFNLADDEVLAWKPFICDCESFSLEHLNACKHTFVHPDRAEKYTLFFTFSHHVFTCESPEENQPLHNYYPFPPTDLRVFDHQRYELSKYLPDIIASLPQQFFYHGGYGRYCSCTIKHSDGSEVTYQIVYRVWKQRGKMRFHVESAYPLLEKPGKPKKVSFWVICHNLLRGKKMPRPSS